MITTINNEQRKFLVQSQGFGNSFDIFCNLKDIPKVVASNTVKNDSYSIYEFWNRKLKKVSKKFLKELYEANQIDANNKVFTIDIFCKEWFDKVNGNSYHAGEVTVNFGMDSQQNINIPFTYGYDSMYLESAYKKLQEAGLLPKFAEYQHRRDYINSNGIKVSGYITRDCKKAELMAYNN